MKSHTKNLRFNHNPLNLILGTRKKQGLRIGYMEAALDGFYPVSYTHLTLPTN